MDTADIKPIAIRELKEGSLEALLAGIIDDIDTAGNMFHPEIDGYFKYIQVKIAEMHELVESDGYKLFAIEC